MKRIHERNIKREERVNKELERLEQCLSLLEKNIHESRGLKKYKIYLDVFFGLFIMTVISIVGVRVGRAANAIAETANAIAYSNLNLQREQYEIMLADRLPTFVITHDEISRNEFNHRMRTLEISNVGGDIYEVILRVHSVLPVNIYKQVGEREEVFTFALVLNNRGVLYDQVSRVFTTSNNISLRDIAANSMGWLNDELRNRFGHDIRVSFDVFSTREYLSIVYYDFAMQPRSEDYWIWGVLRKVEEPLFEFGDSIIALTTEWWGWNIDWENDGFFEGASLRNVSYLESVEQIFSELSLERIVEMLENFFL